MTPSSGLDTLRAFYKDRGYHASIGAGRNPALLVIDFSLAFTRSGSDFPGGDFASEIEKTIRLLAAFRTNWPVLFTTIAYTPDRLEQSNWAKKVPWLGSCIKGTEAVTIDPALSPRPGETIIEKEYPSAFFGTDLERHLRNAGTDTLVITGCTTSVCVRATAIDAMQRGFTPLLPADAIGEFDPALHELHLLDLQSRYADVTTTQGILDYLATLAPKTAAESI